MRSDDGNRSGGDDSRKRSCSSRSHKVRSRNGGTPAWPGPGPMRHPLKAPKRLLREQELSYCPPSLADGLRPGHSTHTEGDSSAFAPLRTSHLRDIRRDPPRLRFDSNQSSDWPIVFETIRVPRVEASRMFIAEKEITANVSKLIFGAAIAAASIATPALAAYKSKPISAHQNGYVARSSQGRGVYDFVPAPRSIDNSVPLRDPKTWVGDPAGRPYVYVPGQASGGGGS